MTVTFQQARRLDVHDGPRCWGRAGGHCRNRRRRYRCGRGSLGRRGRVGSGSWLGSRGYRRFSGGGRGGYRGRRLAEMQKIEHGHRQQQHGIKNQLGRILHVAKVGGREGGEMVSQ